MADPMHDPAPGAAASAAATPGVGAQRPPSLAALLQELLGELPALFSDRVELLSLELRRAGQALLRITALVVMTAIVGVTAWLAVWGVVVGVLIALGLHWALALALVTAANLLVAWWAVRHVRSLLPRLALPATRRHLMFSRSTAAPPPPPQPPVHDRRPPFASTAAGAAAAPAAPAGR